MIQKKKTSTEDIVLEIIVLENLIMLPVKMYC